MTQRKAPRGRPVQGSERKVRYNVMLTPSVAAELERLGAGNRSVGIEEAVRRVRESARRRP